MSTFRMVRMVGLFGVFLAACTFGITQTHGWTRVMTGIVAYVLLFGLIWLCRLKSGDLGLSWARVRNGLRFGLVVSLLVVIGFSVAYLIAPDIFRDERYHLGLWMAISYALLVVPLQTVLFEELLFRGLIWGWLRKVKSAHMATQASSALFGLWHIVPSLAINAAAISVGGIGINRGLLVAGTVVVTYGAGVLLCELRRRSDSLLAPILVHWTINGFAVLLAAFAWRAS